ncbi:CAP domain-containing protein [Silvibacterium sp.]|uniref:CAP domain-containing protein n=1 Tax=Silvibacterium sp. TaxID=1964179 RepID=UPI0039E7143D
MNRAIFIAACAGLLLFAPHAHAQDDPTQGGDGSIDKPHRILELTNQDRAAHGLQPLVWDDALARAAQTHTERMAQEKSLSHQYPGEPPVTDRASQAGAHFQAIAENTAMGGDERAIEKEWMNSTPHRTNILDPQMNHIGIGVVARNGYLFATEDFSNAAEVLNVQQVEDKVVALLKAQNLDASMPRDIAETACLGQGPLPTGSTPRAIVRFQTSDLSQLPSQVAAQLHSGQFTKAAVGACTPAPQQGNFTSYRVAVLLY